MIEIRVGKMRTLPSGEVENVWRTVKGEFESLAAYLPMTIEEAAAWSQKLEEAK